MSSFKGLFLTLAGGLLLCNLSAQQHRKEDFTSCAAAFLNQQMIVNEYTPQGKCTVDVEAQGELTVQFAELSSASTAKPGKVIPFKIAIRDGNTQTLLLFSEKTYRSIDIREVLAQCKKGDSIVLLMVERDWALPHAEILVRAAQ